MGEITTFIIFGNMQMIWGIRDFSAHGSLTMSILYLVLSGNLTAPSTMDTS